MRQSKVLFQISRFSSKVVFFLQDIFIFYFIWVFLLKGGNQRLKRYIFCLIEIIRVEILIQLFLYFSIFFGEKFFLFFIRIQIFFCVKLCNVIRCNCYFIRVGLNQFLGNLFCLEWFDDIVGKIWFLFIFLVVENLDLVFCCKEVNEVNFIYVENVGISFVYMFQIYIYFF